MAEKLSQEQIDALLKGALGGEQPSEPAVEENPEKQYRKYDFYSPRKFTKDRIKLLSGVFESYTRMINSRLNSMLRTSCEITVESIEEQRYYEFSNALTDNDILALASVQVSEKESDETVLVYLDQSMALSMMDRMMGGEGKMAGDVEDDYSYTNLELRMYEDIVKILIGMMGSSWENYLPIDFQYSRTEVNPTFVQLIRMDEIVVLIDLKLQFDNSSGRMSICLPAMMLTNIFAEISKANPNRQGAKEDKSEEIFDKLRDSTLEIIAELGSTQLALSDIYHLSVGDVIDLGRPKDSPVYLEIGGYNWFSGRMGVYNKNLAVKVDEMCYQADERSE